MGPVRRDRRMGDTAMNEAVTRTGGSLSGSTRRWAVLCGGLLSLAALLIALVVVMHKSKVTNELSLPLLAISGVVALLGALAVVAISFALTNLSDRTQALGLPSGSVRAVIALSLVVLFAILSVYLFSSLHNGGRLDTEECLTAEEVIGLQAGPRPLQVLLMRQMPSAETSQKCAPLTPTQEVSNIGMVEPGAAWAAAQDGAKAHAARYTIRYRDTPNPAGEDFAKQLLVLIGTLVTSVASFYFGAKAVSEARDVVSGITPPPTLVGVAPDRVQVDWTGTLHLMGNSLNQVREVQIVFGSTRITATSVTSNDGRVEAKLTIPPDAPTGSWDVRAVDKQGRTGELAAGLIVTKPPPGGTPGGSAGDPTTDTPPLPPNGRGKPSSPPGARGEVPATTRPGAQEARTRAPPPEAPVEPTAGHLTPAAPDRPDAGGQAPANASDVIDATAPVQEAGKSALGDKLADAAVALEGAAGRLGHVVRVSGGVVVVVVGVMLGLLQSLLQDRRSFDALKSALLREASGSMPYASPDADAGHEWLRAEVRIPRLRTVSEQVVSLQALVDEVHALSGDPGAAGAVANLVRVAQVLAESSDRNRRSEVERALASLRERLDRGDRPTAGGAA